LQHGLTADFTNGVRSNILIPMQWYYSLNGQRLGPVAQSDFEKLVTDGVVKADTLVWSQGMAEWLPYAKVAAGAATPGVDDGTELCAVSGKRYPRSQMINYAGKWISAEHRDEFFQRQREGVSQQLAGDSVVPGPFGYAGFWLRFCAKFIDGIILWCIGMIFNVVLAKIFLGTFNPWSGAVANAGTSQALMYTVVTNIIAIAIALAYAWVFISRYSATPGKMAVGLKIYRSDGAKLTTGRIIGRYFAEWLSGLTLAIGYIIAAFDDEKRALHDRVCDTRVIRTR
jgi:uncharacterized RDD family membrane protein YckC